MSAEAHGPRQLVLLRHGRTAWNHETRIQGQLEVDLDETGHAQSARAAVALAQLQPVVLWSSDLARARQTVSYLADATGLTPHFDARLREYALGPREGLTHGEYADVAPDEFAEFRRGNFDAVPGGEGTEQVRVRMLAACRELLARLAPGQVGVAVTHGAAIRVVVAAILDWPDTAVHSLRGLDNCGWVVLEQHDDRPVRLAAYNRVAGDPGRVGDRGADFAP